MTILDLLSELFHPPTGSEEESQREKCDAQD